MHQYYRNPIKELNNQNSRAGKEQNTQEKKRAKGTGPVEQKNDGRQKTNES